MKKFIENSPQIVSAMNFHAYGDLWIYPYNYDPTKGNPALKNNISAYNIYKDFQKNSPRDPSSKAGPATQAINYTANGEASDWMLHNHSIIALSPELGNRKKYSKKFYPKPRYIPKIVEANLRVIKFFIGMHKVNLVVKKFFLSKDKKNFRVIVLNKGIGDIGGVRVGIEFYWQKSGFVKRVRVRFVDENLWELGLGDGDGGEMLGRIGGKNNGFGSKGGVRVGRRNYLVFDAEFETGFDGRQRLDFEVGVVMGGKVLDKVRNSKGKKGINVGGVAKWLNGNVLNKKSVKVKSKDV
jgi:hypothetical protein